MNEGAGAPTYGAGVKVGKRLAAAFFGICCCIAQYNDE